MSRVYWSLLLGLGILLVGIFLGITGLMFLPIVGIFVILAIVFWLADRKARHKRPVE